MIENDNLKLRIISSLFMIFIILIFLFSNKFVFLVLSQLLLFITNWELLRLLEFRKNSESENSNYNYFLSRCQLQKYDFFLIFSINLFIISFYFQLIVLQYFFSILIIFQLFKFFKKDLVKVSAVLFILISFICLIYLRLDDNYFSYFSFILMFAICVDISAFFVGKSLGGPKLAFKLSPGKTISGAIGGILIPIFFCIVLFLKNSDFISIFSMTIILSIVAQVGDLVESKLKRYCHVKDSSNLIPGHGGILDRLDSILALIVFVTIMKLFNFDLFFIV